MAWVTVVDDHAEGATPVAERQVDVGGFPEFLGRAAQLAKYRAHLDWMEHMALSPEASAAREPAASASAPTPTATPTSGRADHLL